MIMSCMGNYFILIVHNHEMILFCHFIVTKEIGREYLDAVITLYTIAISNYNDFA